MKRLRVGGALMLLVGLTGLVGAQEAMPLLVAQGIVEKVDKESLTIQPRADGKAGKPITLRLTGTSKVAILTSRDSGGKVVAVQKETDPKDLSPKQVIAVTYTTTKEGKVLLSAIVQPPPAK